jgi:hypothetical protein
VEAIGKLLDHLGYATPLFYAGVAYWFFAWTDENVSDNAKAALAGTMKLSGASPESISTSLVEIFDHIYSKPLLSWRALFRSVLFTAFMTMILMLEVRYTNLSVGNGLDSYAVIFIVTFLANALTDYVSLFAIRLSLARLGHRPLLAITLGTTCATVIVIVGTLARVAMWSAMFFLFWFNRAETSPMIHLVDQREMAFSDHIPTLLLTLIYMNEFTIVSSLPALAVFAWLPLFALGIMVARLLMPLAWLVTKTQWVLKQGDKHPLRAIGYLAALFVFVASASLQFAFR